MYQSGVMFTGSSMIAMHRVKQPARTSGFAQMHTAGGTIV